MKPLKSMTVADFKALPFVTDVKEPSTTFDAVVLLPTRHRHSSGYRCIELVAVQAGQPLYRFGTSMDVLALDGIGGGGKEYNLHSVEPKGWQLDLLDCGYLRIYTSRGFELEANIPVCSTGEIYAVRTKKEQ